MPRNSIATAARVFLAYVLAGVSPDTLFAQDSSTTEMDRGIVAWTIGLPGHGSTPFPQLFTTGVHLSRARKNRLSAEFDVGTMPRLLVEGAIAYGMRIGIGLALQATPQVVVVPSAGMSLVGVIGEQFGTGAFGANGGFALLHLPRGRTGLKVGMTWHQFRGGDGRVWLLELGLIRRDR